MQELFSLVFLLPGSRSSRVDEGQLSGLPTGLA